MVGAGARTGMGAEEEEILSALSFYKYLYSQNLV